MTTTFTAPQIVRFAGWAHRTRTYWRVCAFKPDGTELRCYWLSPAGWLLVQRGRRRFCRYRTKAAAQRAIAKLGL